MFEKFNGKAKKLVHALALTAAIVTPNQEAQAEPAGRAKTTAAEKVKAEQIDESKITESGKLFRKTIKELQADLKNVKTQEDANWLLRDHFGVFITEYYMPSKVNVKEGAYGTTEREYSPEDLKLVLNLAREMKKIVESLNDKYEVEAYDKRIKQIEDMIKKLEDRTSLAGQKRQKILEQF
jgi:hypothetical protein